MTRLQIQYFLAVAESGSFTRAAEALYVAQPSITKQIKALETELEAQLLVRGSRGVELTEAGRLYRDCFARMEAEFAQCRSRVEALRIQEDHTLHFAAMEGIAIPGYNRFVQDFCARHPEGEYDLVRSELHQACQALRERRIDLAMVYDDWVPQLEQEFDAFQVTESEYVAVMKPSHPLARCGRLTRELCAGVSLILTESDCHHLQAVCPARFLTQLGFDLSLARVTRNYLSCFSALEVSDGIILLDEFSQIPSPERYVRVPTGIRHHCCSIWNRGKKKPLFETFLRELRQADLHN